MVRWKGFFHIVFGIYIWAGPLLPTKDLLCVSTVLLEQLESTTFESSYSFPRLSNVCFITLIMQRNPPTHSPKFSSLINAFSDCWLYRAPLIKLPSSKSTKLRLGWLVELREDMKNMNQVKPYCSLSALDDVTSRIYGVWARAIVDQLGSAQRYECR